MDNINIKHVVDDHTLACINKMNTWSHQKLINMKTILLKIDEDNDIFEMRIGNEVYTLDNVYLSEYGDLFDELNMAIEIN